MGGGQQHLVQAVVWIHPILFSYLPPLPNIFYSQKTYIKGEWQSAY